MLPPPFESAVSDYVGAGCGAVVAPAGPADVEAAGVRIGAGDDPSDGDAEADGDGDGDGDGEGEGVGIDLLRLMIGAAVRSGAGV